MKIYYFTWILAFLAIYYPLWGMQLPQPVMEVETPKLFVLNNTGDKIVVRYQFENLEPEAPVVLTSEKEQPQTFKVGALNRLRSLKIAVYGKYKEWLTAQTLSANFLPLEELMNRVHEAQVRYPNESLILTVTKKPYIGMLLPYNFTVHPLREYVKTRGIPLVWQKFPSALQAWESRQQIEPHMILHLPKNASRDEIQKAYERDSAKWGPKAEDPDPKKAAEARHVLAFINAAYQSLIDGDAAKEAFRQMVRQELETGNVH